VAENPGRMIHAGERLLGQPSSAMSPTSIRQYDTRNLFTLSSLSNIKTSCLLLFAAVGLFKRFCHERFQLAVEHGSCGRNPAVAELSE
jgi:hypothetical protein